MSNIATGVFALLALGVTTRPFQPTEIVSRKAKSSWSRAKRRDMIRRAQAQQVVRVRQMISARLAP